MKKLLYVDCIMRGEVSRTAKIAERFLGAIDTEKFEIERLNLLEENLEFLTDKTLKQRDVLLEEGNLDHEMFKYAKQFAEADVVVMAAPFWDLSFPALLKVYVENISVGGITFGYNDTGMVGMCKGADLVFITSRGGFYTDDALEQGSRYIEALKTLYGFDNYTCIAAEGVDIQGLDIDGFVEEACKKAEEIAKNI